MKVAGFTFIRNALKFDFPVAEAIASVLPLCDAFFVAVGDSDDNTLDFIRRLAPGKLQVLETTWDASLNKGGEVYANETNKAFDAIPAEYDWCFYIQGDEVIHEKDLPAILGAMQKNLQRLEVEGLLFSYRHFFGTYDYVAASRKWYRNEVRVIRNDKTIRSYRDAQGFRKGNKKLKVMPVEAVIYHYGWVRHPKYMQNKIYAVMKYYGCISEEAATRKAGEMEFNYSRKYDALVKFSGTHPAVMQPRIERLNWTVEVDLARVNLKFRYRILFWWEKLTGIRLFEFRNYKIIEC
jgi:hypothetical protein